MPNFIERLNGHEKKHRERETLTEHRELSKVVFFGRREGEPNAMSCVILQRRMPRTLRNVNNGGLGEVPAEVVFRHQIVLGSPRVIVKQSFRRTSRSYAEDCSPGATTKHISGNVPRRNVPRKSVVRKYYKGVPGAERGAGVVGKGRTKILID